MAGERKALPEVQSSSSPNQVGQSPPKPGRIMIVGIVVVIVVMAGGFFLAKKPRSAVKPAPDPVLYDLGDFTTNLSDASALKYVKTDVTLELNNKRMETEVKNDEPVLRDCIISLLNNETSDDIMVNRTKLKNDAMQQLNKHLSTGEVSNIYFSDLIMQ